MKNNKPKNRWCFTYYGKTTTSIPIKKTKKELHENLVQMLLEEWTLLDERSRVRLDDQF